jgi:O-antigen/teichoic acid export membrane protein
LARAGAAAAIWALVIGNLIGSVVAWWWRPRSVGVALDAPPSSLTALLIAGLPFVLVGLAGAVFQAMDVYVVKLFHWTGRTPDALALYAAPFRILNVLLLVPTAWGVAALPRYVALVKHDPAALRARLRRDVRQSTGIGLALSVGCMLFAAPLTQIGLGAAYASASPILALVGWMSLPVCLSAPAIALLTAAHRQQRIAISVLGAGVLALVANVAWGWLAAAQQADAVPRLLGVAAIKVASMSVLLGLYWLSARGTLHEGR